MVETCRVKSQHPQVLFLPNQIRLLRSLDNTRRCPTATKESQGNIENSPAKEPNQIAKLHWLGESLPQLLDQAKRHSHATLSLDRQGGEMEVGKGAAGSL